MRQHPLICILIVTSVLTAPLAAQFPPPATELSKFDVALGNWAGKGVVSMSPDGKVTMPWTAHVTYSKILGGHFIQKDTWIEFGGEQPMPPLSFRSIIGWDAHAQKFRAFGMGNMGGAAANDLFWTTDGKVVAGVAQLFQGVPQVETSVTEFSKDGFVLRIDMSSDGAPTYEHVKGTFKRTEKPFSAERDMKPFAPVPDAMQKLSWTLGDWDIEADIVPMPGADPMNVTARETITHMFGGHVQRGHVLSPPDTGAAYEAVVYTAWSDAEACFISLTASNMGEFIIEKSLPTSDGSFVFVSSGFQYGAPYATRTVMKRDGKNAFTVKTHLLAGDAPPALTFDGSFSRVMD